MGAWILVFMPVMDRLWSVDCLCGFSAWMAFLLSEKAVGGSLHLVAVTEDQPLSSDLVAGCLSPCLRSRHECQVLVTRLLLKGL